MRNITKGLCLAVLLSFSAGLAAQGGPQYPKPQTPPAKPMASTPKDEKSVTVVGCLQKGDKPNTYILTNVTGDTAAIFGSGTMTRPTEPGKPGTTGTTGTAAMTVTLHPTGGVNLAEHVGHQVEVIGMVVPQNRPKKDDDAALNPNQETPPNPPAVNPPAANPANPAVATPPAATPPSTAGVSPRPSDAPAAADSIGTSGSVMEHRLNVKTVNHKADKCPN